MAAGFIRAEAAAGQAGGRAGVFTRGREGARAPPAEAAQLPPREEMGLGRRGAEDGQRMRPWKAARSGTGRARRVGSFSGDLTTLIREVALWIPALLQVCSTPRESL